MLQTVSFSPSPFADGRSIDTIKLKFQESDSIEVIVPVLTVTRSWKYCFGNNNLTSFTIYPKVVGSIQPDRYNIWTGEISIEREDLANTNKIVCTTCSCQKRFRIECESKLVFGIRIATKSYINNYYAATCSNKCQFDVIKDNGNISFYRIW